MSKKPASLTSDLLARKGEAEPSSMDPATRMTLSAGSDFPSFGGSGFGEGEGRPRPPEPEIIYTAEETRSGSGNTRLIIGAVLGIIIVGGILLMLSGRTDRGVAPVSPDITTQSATPAPTQSEPAPSEPAAPETLATVPAAPQTEPQSAIVPGTPVPETPASAAVAPTPSPANVEAAPAEKSEPAEKAVSAEEAAPVAAKPSAKGAYVVQIQALRDEKSAKASWAHLTKRYPAILGGHALDIEKADLGAKGIWYRVRAAGFETKAAATSTCGKLKAAGQDCIVKKR